jgi:hypothetical protein
MTSSLGDFGAGTLLAEATTSLSSVIGQPESFDLGGLDIPLAAGTYWLEIGSTADSALELAPSVGSTLGTLDGYAECVNPFEVEDQCGPPYWGFYAPGSANLSDRQLAIDLDGAAITPEPPTWMLMGTGLVALCGFAGRRPGRGQVVMPMRRRMARALEAVLMPGLSL